MLRFWVVVFGAVLGARRRHRNSIAADGRTPQHCR